MLRLMRLPDPEPEGEAVALRPCELAGCTEKTRRRKPFCPRHTHMNPHASRVLATAEQYRRELRSRRWALDGPHCGDVRAALVFEDLSSIGLIRSVYGAITPEHRGAISSLVEKLREAGHVQIVDHLVCLTQTGLEYWQGGHK